MLARTEGETLVVVIRMASKPLPELRCDLLLAPLWHLA